MNDVPAGEVYLGIPATPIKEQMQIMACTNKLPEMRSQLRAMGKQLASLQAAPQAAAAPHADATENKAA
jgi:UDP-3-O-[3-hydroxymyristoyl] glucosamine N-acyltransferase